jgi:eukaryotic-like serine/threonine-protein kinase
LGVVLYEMMSGRRPFAAESAAATASAILTKEPLPVARFASEAPEELQRIVRKCLEKDRERRYQSGRDLTIDLENLRHPRQAPRTTSQNNSAAEVNNRIESNTGGGPNRVLLSRRTLTLSGSILVLIAAAIVYAVWFRVEPAARQLGIKSLAVLPLKSLSTDANDDYLGLGIADTIITKISQIGELTVRPTSAVRKYVHEEMNSLEAAQQLQTGAVLDGSVQRAGDHLRVNVNLLRVRDGASLWAESFDMKQSDIFTIQDNLSKEIVARLKLKLSPTEAARLDKRYTTNQEAYEYYMKGRANFERVTTAIGDRQAIDAAISYFKKAVELDPKYALAYAALGGAYMWMANFNDPDNDVWVGLAQMALSQAESLDPQLAEIHDARFEYYFSKYGNWDLAQAYREGRQALALNPSVGHRVVGTIYDHLGLDEAKGLRESQRDLEIDPTNTYAQYRLIESYQLYGKFDEAIEAQRRFFGTPGPEYALIGKGRLDEAQPLLEEAVKKNSGDLRARGRLALLIALRGKFQEAEAAIPPILKQARNNRAYHHITYDIACVYALAGKIDETVKWLRTTAETGMPNYSLFARDPHLDRIRQAPAFVPFMAELKLRWEAYKREFE